MSEKYKFKHQEWFDKGTALFGPNVFEWKFKCPSCGNIQSPNDFRKFKEKGATPETAAKDCIGRWEKDKGCDWAAYGLFRGPWIIEDLNGDESPCFEFYDPKGGDL